MKSICGRGRVCDFNLMIVFGSMDVPCVHLRVCLCRQGQAEAIRRRAIDESKFLGGDMKHTHLVKGLDYVLKQKVKGLQSWWEKRGKGEGVDANMDTTGKRRTQMF